MYKIKIQQNFSNEKNFRDNFSLQSYQGLYSFLENIRKTVGTNELVYRN